jgi:hypothetical protein
MTICLSPTTPIYALIMTLISFHLWVVENIAFYEEEEEGGGIACAAAAGVEVN